MLTFKRGGNDRKIPAKQQAAAEFPVSPPTPRHQASRHPKNSIRRQLLTAMISLIVGLVVTLSVIEWMLQKQSLEIELSKRIEL